VIILVFTATGCSKKQEETKEVVLQNENMTKAFNDANDIIKKMEQTTEELQQKDEKIYGDKIEDDNSKKQIENNDSGNKIENNNSNNPIIVKETEEKIDIENADGENIIVESPENKSQEKNSKSNEKKFSISSITNTNNIIINEETTDTQNKNFIDITNYEGEWMQSYESYKDVYTQGGHLLKIVPINQTTFDFTYVLGSSAPANRIAEIQITNNTLDETNSVVFNWEDTYGNTGYGSLSFEEKKITLTIFGTTMIEDVLWGIYDEKIVFDVKKK